MDGDWFGLAASAAGGGVFGVVGTALGRLAGYFEQKQSHEFEEKRWQHEMAIRRLSIEAGRQQAETEMELADTRGKWEGLSASLAAAATIPESYKFVNAVRALTRPTLTLLLWVITTLVFFNVDEPLRARVTETAVFAATAATLWWFGDRTQSAARKAMSG